MTEDNATYQAGKSEERLKAALENPYNDVDETEDHYCSRCGHLRSYHTEQGCMVKYMSDDDDDICRCLRVYLEDGTPDGCVGDHDGDEARTETAELLPGLDADALVIAQLQRELAASQAWAAQAREALRMAAHELGSIGVSDNVNDAIDAALANTTGQDYAEEHERLIRLETVVKAALADDPNSAAWKDNWYLLRDAVKGEADHEL